MFAFSSQREATFKEGCLSVRLSVLEKLKESASPGPIYNVPSRVLSNEKSLRNITFGTGFAR